MTTSRPTPGPRLGGAAALYVGAAYLLAMPFFLLVVNYPAATDPAEKVALLAGHQQAMQAMYLVTYVIFGLALAVLALGLHDRLAGAAPALMRVATVAGLMWAVTLVASGLVVNAGIAAVVARDASDPGSAQSMWQAVEPVAQGLGGSGGELLGGVWVLLLSIAGLTSRLLPRALGWLGVAVGVVGLLSVVPLLSSAAYAFGLLQIVWVLWMGLTLLRSPGLPPQHDVDPRRPGMIATGDRYA
jgi:hypothetical protein